MSVEVYWGSGSGPAWRALLGLRVKGVAYEGRLLSFGAGDTRSDGFRALNPRGKVPVLVDGDVVLNESLAILAYLDRRTPEPPLFGRTAAEAGQVWRLLLEHENHAAPAFGAVYRPIFFGHWQKDPAAVREAIPAAVAEIAGLAARLDGRDWLVGEALSAADLVWYISLRVMERAATRPAAANFDLPWYPTGARWPQLVSWARRIEAIPGFEQTFPPHWRDGDAPLGLALA